jgi:ADP-dependent phosphofructokinase/glucokinase
MRERLRKDRPMTVISLRMPEDVIEELKEIAPALGFSGYQPLIRAYIGQGLRKDAVRLAKSHVMALTESLRSHGIGDDVISSILAEAQLSPTHSGNLALAETV